MNNHSRLLTALVATVALLVGSAISLSAVAQQPPRPTLQGLQDQINGLQGQINTLNTRVNNPDPPCADTTNRYVDCGNGTVTDTVTGLIWLKNALCTEFVKINYADAIAAAANLADGSCGLSDHSKPGDWRLPTQAEWQVMVQKALALGCEGSKAPTLTNTPGTGCYIDGPQPFSNVAIYYYWTSTSIEDDPTIAHVVELFDGAFFGHPKTDNTIYAWPVRGGQ